jgi:hypothetical protein
VYGYGGSIDSIPALSNALHILQRNPKDQTVQYMSQMHLQVKITSVMQRPCATSRRWGVLVATGNRQPRFLENVRTEYPRFEYYVPTVVRHPGLPNKGLEGTFKFGAQGFTM